MDKQIQNRLVSKFFNDPDFVYVVEMLSNKVGDLRDIATIDIKESAETIKAQIAGRQETLKVVDSFKRDVEVAKGIINNKPTTFK